MQISRRKFLEGAGATAMIAVGSASILSLTRPHAMRAAPRYNIITIMTDDQDSDSLAVMRHLISYPRGSWINFTNAICNDGICAPSRASFLTGLYTRHHGVQRNGYTGQLDGKPTLPVWLRNAGYRTALVGKYLWRYGEVEVVPDGWDIFQELDMGTAGLAAVVSEQATEFIRTTSEPFFLHLAPRDPHVPATPQAQYTGTAVWLPPHPPSLDEDISDKVSWVHIGSQMDDVDNDWLAERQEAHRALLGVDDMVMAVIDALDTRGILEKTVICFLSDNGFLWGEHRLVRKHWHYEEVIRVPMLIRYPGLGSNREENRVVSIVDLAETFTDIAGTIPDRPTDGASLLPMIETPEIEDERAVLLERYPDSRGEFSFVGVRVAGWTYVEFDNGEKEMYDLTADPYQLDNLAGLPEYEAVQAGLRNRMLALLSAGNDPTPTTTATIWPSDTPTSTATPDGPTATETSTATVTDTPTSTPPLTDTPTPTSTPTVTVTSSPTWTPTATSTPSATPGLSHCQPAVAGNVIRNPGFEKNKRNWSLASSTGVSFTISKADPYQCSKVARFDVLITGANVQFFQNALRLKPGTAYRLSLAARSSSGRSAQVKLASAKYPTLNYGLSDVVLRLSPEWTDYTIDFTTTGFAKTVSNGRLTITMAGPNLAGDMYAFDDFVLIPLAAA